MVSEWMENGTVNQFISNNPDVSRIDLVGFRVIFVSQELT